MKPASRSFYRKLALSALALVLLTGFCLALGIRVIWQQFPQVAGQTPSPALQFLPGTPNPQQSATALVLIEALTPTATITATQVPTANPVPFPPEFPTGKIAYVCLAGGFSHICRIGADGAGSVQLTSGSFSNFFPALSPDGERIVFVSRGTGAEEIYTVDSAGGPLERMTNGIGSPFAPSFTTDSKSIIFGNRQGGIETTWKMGSRGTDPAPWETLPEGATFAVQSPVAETIAFAANWTGAKQIYTLELPERRLQKWTDLTDVEGRISWSPGGDRLAFAAGAIGSRELYVINLLTNEVVRITDGGDNFQPSWSPQGAWLAFTSFRDGNNEIYIQRMDGSGVTRLTHSIDADYHPWWGK